MMATLGDASFHGHLGFAFTGKGGGAQSVAQLVDEFTTLGRICYQCMLHAFKNSDSNAAAWVLAKARCDLYCEGCMMAEVEHNRAIHYGRPPPPRVCTVHAARADAPFYKHRCSACQCAPCGRSTCRPLGASHACSKGSACPRSRERANVRRPAEDGRKTSLTG